MNSVRYIFFPFILAMLALTLTWTTLTYADEPGDLDTTFNGTGIVTTTISTGNDGGFSVTLQPDGNILVSGTSDSYGPSSSIALLRYTTDGVLDNAFAGNGIVTTPIGMKPNNGFSVVVQPDNKVVVAGAYGSLGAGPHFTVVRYKDNGTLDTNFNTTGIVTTPIHNNDIGWSVALQNDNKIVVAGESQHGINNSIAVVRYDPDGDLDSGFNGTGIITTPVRGYDAGHSVAIQPDNKIVVAGYSADTNNASSSYFVILRYNDNGTLDSLFNGGVLTTSIGARANAIDVALQPDGKIVVAGSSDGDFAIARYNNGGTLDAGFGSGGIVTTDIGDVSDAARSIAIQPDGKIVVAGFRGDDSIDTNGDIALVRYDSNGNLDTSFGNSGIVTTSVSIRDWGLSVALQPDGKIVVGGFTTLADDGAAFVVLRYIGGNPSSGNSTLTYLPVILKN